MQTNSEHWLQSAHSTHLPLLGLSAPAPHVPPHGTPPFPNPSCARFPRQLSQRRSSTAPYRRARPSGAAPRCSPRAAAPRPSAPPRALPHGLQPRPGALRPSDRIHRCPRAPPRPLAGIGSARRGARGLRGTARSSVRLSWAAGSRLSAPEAPPALTSVPAGPCLTSLFSPPAAVAQQLLRPFSLLSRSTPSAARGSAPAATGP